MLNLLDLSKMPLGPDDGPPVMDVLPPDIMPIVILSGSDYEMGYQYGQQAGSYIERSGDAAWGKMLQKFSRPEVINALKANQHYIKKSIPECIDQMRGIADGATACGYKVSYIDVLLLNVCLDLQDTLAKPGTCAYPQGAEKETLPPKGCSVCSAWGSATKDGRLIGVDSFDGPDPLYAVVIVAFPESGNNYVCAAGAGELASHFLMNNQGLFVGNSGGGDSQRGVDFDYGLNWTCSLPHIVRFANNATEAKDMMTSWQINSPENFHFVDVKGNAFVVEKSAAIQGVREPGDFGEKDFLFSTNNYLTEAMRLIEEGEFVKRHGGYGRGSAVSRNIMLWDMLHNYHGKVDVEFAKMMLRFPGNLPPNASEGMRDTKICRLLNNWVAVLQPDNGNEGVVHICTGSAGRVVSTPAGRNTSLPVVDGTHTFCQLKLAASPKEVVQAARTSAEEDIGAANERLKQMNYTDTGYAALKEIYSLAYAEYLWGSNALTKGFLAEGKKALPHFARAATAFTRSQAHAKQVYEALVPPPVSPFDLGLEPFGGDWGDWEIDI